MIHRGFAALLIAASVLVLTQPTFAGEEAHRDTSSVALRFDPARDAAADIKAAVAEAARTHRRVLIDVGGEWCIWCHRLDSLYATHPDLSAYLTKHYVLVKVNYSKENKNEQVLSQYPKIPGYPHYFVLDNDGKLLHSQDTGALEAGKGHDPVKVLAFLKEWAL